MSFKRLSETSGVDAGQACRICRGDFSTYSENVVRICIALDVAVPLPAASMAGAPVLDPRLEAAVVAAWDRSEAGTERLLRLLDALSKYREVGTVAG